MALDHERVRSVRCPITCIVAETFSHTLYLGVIERKSVATSFEHVVRISVFPNPLESSLRKLSNVLSTRKRAHFRRWTSSVASHKGLVKLGDATASSIWKYLESREDPAAIAFVERRLKARRHRPPNSGAFLQRASIDDAVSIFDWGPSRTRAQITRLAWVGDGETELRVYEDQAIALDSAEVPGLSQLVRSQTGVAVFARDDEELTVITANKLPLERVFGVDLIYINEVAQAVVLVQYKVLEKRKKPDGSIAWRYRPDEQLRNEIERMESLRDALTKGGASFRISDEVHFFKFVKRNSSKRAQAGITISKNHFDRLSPDRRRALDFGPEKGGNYLRHETFCGLIRSGYIGSSPRATQRIVRCMDQLLREGHAVVLATQRRLTGA